MRDQFGQCATTNSLQPNSLQPNCLRASVIVPVYNAVRALELVLTGYSRQTFHNFELVIADDGSGPEVGHLVGAFSKSVPFPVHYLFHPDEGYRKTKILNQAVLAASTPYLIFADADCIPHRNFVEAHCDLVQPGAVLCGRRVNLNGAISSKLSPEDVLAGKLERFTLIRILRGLIHRGGHWEEAFWLKNQTLHRWINRKEPTLLGCNFSLEKKLLESVNGFNEDFSGYAGEDTELEYRLRLARAKFGWVRLLAIQYHLYHPTRARSQSNVEVLERTRSEGKAVCRNGLRKDLT